MIRKAIQITLEKATLRNVIITLLISFILQYVLIAKLLPVFLDYSGGVKNPDQIFGYTTETIQNLYNQLGEKGRTFYIRMLWVDNMYTIFTGIGFSLLLGLLVQKEKWYVILPMTFTIFDLVENILHICSLTLFPAISNILVTASSFSTIAKLSVGGVSLLVFCLVLVKSIIKKIKTD